MDSTYEFIRMVSGTVGVVFFVAIFLGVTTYAIWPKNRARFNSAAEIPLKED